MPTTTPTPDTTGAAADGAAPHAVPASTARRARAGEVEDRLWAALRGHPGATATELAAASGASRSAVGKLLAAWATDGSATSVPGATPRAARRWTAAPSDLGDSTLTGLGDCAGVGEGDHDDSVPGGDGVDSVTSSAATDSDSDQTGARSAAEIDVTEAGSATGVPGQREGGPAAAESGTESEIGSSAEKPEARRTPQSLSPRNRSGSARLPKGALRGQVEDYLAETPGEHSPVEIGQVLGRSSGAVANALESLVELGHAVQTSERPKRYQHIEHDDAADATDGSRRGPGGRAASGSTGARGRRSAGVGVAGVGAYVTVLAVVPLEATGAVTTDEIAEWVRDRLSAQVLFACAAHGVTRAALSAGADPSRWAALDNTALDNTTPDETTQTGGTAEIGDTGDADQTSSAGSGLPGVAISEPLSSDVPGAVEPGEAPAGGTSGGDEQEPIAAADGAAAAAQPCRA